MSYHEVLPSDTDPNITNTPIPNTTDQFYQHRVYSGAATSSPFLCLFLVGLGGHPVGVQSLLQVAASLGHHVVGLEYLSNTPEGDLCGNCSDCYGPLHAQSFDGQNESSVLNVDANNCILNRLVKLLAWLSQHFAAENWGQFLDASGSPVWGNIIAAGHSLGGGHAAWIAKQYAVKRLAMFGVGESVTADGNSFLPSYSPAHWLTLPHATPGTSYFGFVNAYDRRFSRGIAGWTALGLPAPLTGVENNLPPYNNAHQLVSLHKYPDAAHPNLDPHIAIVADEARYKEVWKYLLKA